MRPAPTRSATRRKPANRLVLVSLEDRTVPTNTTLAGGNSSTWFISDRVITDNGLPIDGNAIFGADGSGASVTDAWLPDQSDALDFASMVWINNVQVGGALTNLGSNVEFAPQSIAGLTTSYQYYAASSTATLRSLLTMTNPTGSPITVAVDWAGNTASDGDTVINGTGSGDGAFTAADRWVLTDESFPGGDTGYDPAVTWVLSGPGAAVTPAGVSQFVFDWATKFGILARYNVTIGPGQTRSLLWFNQLNDTTYNGLANAPSFDSALSNADLTSGLTTAQLNQIANWAYGSLSVSLSGGDLTVIDTTGQNNELTAKVIGSDLVLGDATQMFQSAPVGTLSADRKTLTIPLTAVTGKLTFDTKAGNDSLTVDFSGGNPIPAGGLDFNGGDPTAGPGDTLALVGGTTTTQTFYYTNEHDGSVVFAGALAGKINFTGLEPISSTVTAAYVVLNFSATSETITVTSAGAGMTRVDSDVGGEATTFSNPETVLQIHAGDTGDDVIVVTSFGSGFHAALAINGGTGTDSIAIDPALNLTAAGAGLDLTAESIVLNGGSITTVGDQSYNGAVTLGANTTTTSTSGRVSYNGTVNGTTGNKTVSVESALSTTFNGIVGDSVPLGAITVTAATFTVAAAIHTVGATITVNADFISILAVVNAGANTVLLRQRTAGQFIDLGGFDAPGTLGLTDAELDRITAGTLTIGDTASGSITVSSDITRPASTNVELISGGDVVLTGGQVDTGGGTLLFHPGTTPRVVKPTHAGTDATAGTVKFASNLAIVADTTAVDTGYTQLNVIGSVDLTGVNLDLSGGLVFAPGNRMTIVRATAGLIGTFANHAVGVPYPFNGKLIEVCYNGLAKTVELTLAPSLGTLGIPFWTVGVPYVTSIPISGGTAPYTLTPGTTGLPPGLTAAVVGNTVRVAGTPTTEGNFNAINLSVTDAASVVAAMSYAINVTTTIAGGYAFDPVAGTFWFQVVGHASANTRITLASGTTPSAGNLQIAATDDAPIPLNGNLNIALQDSNIFTLQQIWGKAFAGVRLNLGGGNDVVDASRLGLAMSNPFHRVNVVDAGAGNDTLIGGGRNDTLNGGDGNDSILGNLGRDEMAGGLGNDTVIADYADFTVSGPSISAGGGKDELWMDGKPPPAVPTVPGNATYVNFDFESIVGGSGDDAVNSSATGPVYFAGRGGNDSFVGGTGNDTLLGESGHDTLVGGDGDDSIDGGNGNDSVQGGVGADSLTGGDGADFLDYSDDLLGVFVALGTAPALTTIVLGSPVGSAAGDVVDNTFENLAGGAGDDFLMGNNFIDTDAAAPGLQGQGPASDRQGNVIRGNGGHDQVYGQDGDDSLFGDGGNDTVYGNSGDDAIRGDDGSDTLYGGDGNDTMTGGAGGDDLQGNNGDDVLSGDEPTRTRTLVVLTNDGTNAFPIRMTGSNGPMTPPAVVPGPDTLQGSNGADTLDVGGGAYNVADGGLGNDTFILYGTPTTEYGKTLDPALTSLTNQYWGGAGPDTFMVIHAWDIFQLTDGPAGLTVQANNAGRVQAAYNFLNDLQATSPLQTDYDSHDIVVFDQLRV